MNAKHSAFFLVERRKSDVYVIRKICYFCQLQGRSGWVGKMSRPTTRSKNKRHRQEDNGDITSEILRYMKASLVFLSVGEG